MGKVFIVQEPMRRNKQGEMESFMDFRKTMEYGDPVVCLSSGRVAFSPAPMVRKLKQVLKDFCDDDYICATGDPSAIAVASAIAIKNNMGRMKMLKWDKVHGRYILVEIDING